MARTRHIVACAALAVAHFAPTAVAQEEAPQKQAPPVRQPPQRRAPVGPGQIFGTRAQVKSLEEGSITFTILPQPVVRRHTSNDGSEGIDTEEAAEKKKQDESKKEGQDEGEKAEDERKLKVDGDTVVFVGASSEREVGGRKMRTVRFVKGTLEDVKVGREVRVHIARERASRIDVWPAESPAGGEGL